MKRNILTLFCGIAALSAFSVPAKPGLLTARQSDGTIAHVRLAGDEHHHYYLSDDGYLLANRDGFFYYAEAGEKGEVISSDFRISDPPSTPGLLTYLSSINREDIIGKMSIRRMDLIREKMNIRDLSFRNSRETRSSEEFSGGPGLCPGSTYPTKGEQRSLVILVEFPDMSMTLDNPHDYFSRMLNEPGFSDWNGTGSARDYFLECSTGQFLPQFDLYGPVVLPHNMSYYGGNDVAGNDKRPAQMIADACEAIDEEVDFSLYDLDKDGYIDNVFVFYAGEGEAAGGVAETIWPHSWYVSEGISKPQLFDGVILDRYACSCEWVVTNGKGCPDGVGTFIHEFSHVLGLPDLYATDNSNCFTPGEWSVLDTGSYNNNGRTPPAYSAFERYALGWLEPFEMTETTRITLDPIESNRAGIIKTLDNKGNIMEKEYFLVENRQQNGWDTYIPGHGMLVWHIDYDDDKWYNNEVNNDNSHQRIDLVEADNIKYQRKNRQNDTFPGGKKITGLSDNTSPSLKSWAGVRSGVAITNIAENDGVISFDLAYESADAPVIEADGFRWHIEGPSISFTGLDPYGVVMVYDVTGKKVAEVRASDNGNAEAIINDSGVYIVKTSTKTVKIRK